MIDEKTKQIAEGLALALLQGDDTATIGGMSALSLRLDGVDMLSGGVAMSPSGYVLYLLCRLIAVSGERAAIQGGAAGKIVSIHGGPANQ